MSYCGILSCILGFADPEVNAAVIRRVHLGSMATQQTADEVELARLLVEIHPWAEQARFTRGGGEAMSVAVRIARAATGRGKIALCGYHGWHDWYLAANLGGGLSPAAVASAASKQLDGHLLPGLEPAGVPRELAGTIETFRYNRLDELDAALEACGDDLAAIVMEPTRSVDPAPGFLEGVRERATARGAALIFDEISSAWRLCLGGAHRLYGVEPDMAVFAKAISNGFAMGAILGRASLMSAAQGSFISSTYWTEGIGPAAAVAAIRKMRRIDVPAHLKMVGAMVMEGWRRLAEKHGLSVTIGGRPASCSLAFPHPSAAALQTLLTDRMLDRGILAAASCSLTLAHAPDHIDRYLLALDGVFAELAEAIRLDDVERRLQGPVKHSTFKRLVD
jgi:glutamate-1-semialdehyde 2,1-aminomutase